MDARIAEIGPPPAAARMKISSMSMGGTLPLDDVAWRTRDHPLALTPPAPPALPCTPQKFGADVDRAFASLIDGKQPSQTLLLAAQVAAALFSLDLNLRYVCGHKTLWAETRATVISGNADAIAIDRATDKPVVVDLKFKTHLRAGAASQARRLHYRQLVLYAWALKERLALPDVPAVVIVSYDTQRAIVNVVDTHPASVIARLPRARSRLPDVIDANTRLGDILDDKEIADLAREIRLRNAK
jgi:hypothetical protein